MLKTWRNIYNLEAIVEALALVLGKNEYPVEFVQEGNELPVGIAVQDIPKGVEVSAALDEVGHYIFDPAYIETLSQSGMLIPIFAELHPVPTPVLVEAITKTLFEKNLPIKKGWIKVAMEEQEGIPCLIFVMHWQIKKG